jgi:hypothetical protein
MAHRIGADVAPFGPLDRGVMIPGRWRKDSLLNVREWRRKMKITKALAVCLCSFALSVPAFSQSDTDTHKSDTPKTDLHKSKSRVVIAERKSVLVPIPLPRPRPETTTPARVVADVGALDKIFDNVTKANDNDLRYAKMIAESSGTPGGRLRAACYGGIIELNTVLNSSDANALSTQVTSFERISQIADAMNPTSSLMTSCAPAAAIPRVDVLTYINAAVTGVSGLGKYLSSLGVKIPQQ